MDINQQEDINLLDINYIDFKHFMVIIMVIMVVDNNIKAQQLQYHQKPSKVTVIYFLKLSKNILTNIS